MCRSKTTITIGKDEFEVPWWWGRWFLYTQLWKAWRRGGTVTIIRHNPER